MAVMPRELNGAALFIKWIRVLFLMLLYATFGGILLGATGFSSSLSRRVGTWWTSWISRRALAAFGVKLRVHWAGDEYHPLESSEDMGSMRRLAHQVRRHFLISNHYSYVDVMAISAVLPSVFVTSRETEADLFLGYMSRIGGSLFVERRKRTSVQSDLEQITNVLNEGSRVVLFPEGTSSDGRAMLPFKKSLLEAPVRVGAYALPICINYLRVDGKPWPGEERDSICYYGDMKFFEHFKRFTALTALQVDVHILEGLSVQGRDRKQLADELRVKIHSRFQPIM